MAHITDCLNADGGMRSMWPQVVSSRHVYIGPIGRLHAYGEATKQLTAMRYQAMGESLRRLIAVADGLSQPATHIATAGALRVQSDAAGHSAALTLELSTQPIRQAA